MTAEADIRVYGQSGVGAYAPIGSTLPTTASGALDAAFIDLGEISGEDGFEENFDAEGEVVARRWTGEVAAIAVPETTETFTFTCLEETEAVREFVRPNSVTGGSQLSGPGSGAGVAFVFTLIANDGRYKRIVVPEGVVTSRESVVSSNNEPAKYQVTVTARYNSTLGGCSKTYWDDINS